MKTIHPSEEEVNKALSKLTLLAIGTQAGSMVALIALSIWQFRENALLLAVFIIGILGYAVVTIVMFWRGSRARLAGWRNSWLVVEEGWIEQRSGEGGSVRILRANKPQVQETAFWMNIFESGARSFIGIPKSTEAEVFLEMRTAVIEWQKGGVVSKAADSSQESAG